MADAVSPTKSAWIASGVAAAVVVILVAVFAGPAIVKCSGQEGSFGQCVRQSFSDSDAVTADNADSSETSATEVAETVVKDVAETAPVESASVANPLADFDVRVEPNGSYVVAGSAPGSKRVEVYLNGDLVGTEQTVGGAGDWVFVPEERLANGGHEIKVALLDDEQVVDKSYVVMIDNDPDAAPLVIAALPGEASQILQGAGAPIALADARNVVEEAVETATEGATQAVTSVTEIAETAAETVVETTTEVAAVTEETVTEVAETVVEETTTPEPVVEVTKAADTVDNAVEAVVETPKVEEVLEVAVAPVVQTAEELDALEEKITALTPIVAPTIDAIEIDGGRNYFAGAGQNGATVRLYVDNQFVGDTTVKDGRWLFETDAILANRSQRVRADQILGGSAEVAARAEVDFVFEAPVEVAALAETQASDKEEAVTTEVPDSVEEKTELAETEVPVVDEKLVEPVASEPNTETVVEKPTEVASAKVETELDESSREVMSTSDTATPAVETSLPKAGGTVAIVAENDTKAEDMVAATAEPEMVKEAEMIKPVEAVEVAEPETVVPEDTPEAKPVPQLVATSQGDPEDGRFASGKAIIRRGDNLWTIAQRVYGSGFRFTTIYQANTDQIRDPELIYPGQVFELPENAETE